MMMSDQNNETPQPGSIIRFGPWHGVVLDVFESKTSGKHILQIMFAKNIYKQQPAELHVYEELKSGILLPSDRESLTAELQRLSENARMEAASLLEKLPGPVETTVSTNIK
jgi:hypothetical protein